VRERTPPSTHDRLLSAAMSAASLTWRTPIWAPSTEHAVPCWWYPSAS
jgi:hypothetical protein